MSKKFIIIQLLFICLLAGIGGVYFFQQSVKHPPLPMYGQVVGGKLIDANGKPFSLAELNGQVWVAQFFFTTCSDICPMITKNMASLSRTFERLPDIKFVSITVNPEQDTPQRLTEYYNKIPQAKKNWVLLTGSRAVITDIMIKQFKLGSSEEPVFHSPNLTLVDRQGIIRGYYDGTNDEAVRQLFKDAAKIVKYRR